ncbi:MAG: ABC transporter substrate-binding protein [Acidimicrobiia bacterium]|nr:ABC transporter substrate-binding protein [Acidimicrobiia bacterium]
MTLALVAASCAETDPDDGAPTTTVAVSSSRAIVVDSADGDAGGAPTTTGTGPVDPDDAIRWALEYSGGVGGEAAGETVKIGLANNTSFFPEVDDGALLAAQFANDELGGVDGRPIEIVFCLAVTAEDGAACGAQFANDDSIVLALAGSLLAGNQEFYSAISGIKPGYTLGPLAVADYTTSDSVSYTSAALGAGMGGGIFVAQDLQPERAALVVTDDAAGRGAISLLESELSDAGIELVAVFVPPTATAPEIESALQSIGPESVDAILIGLFEQGCIAAYDALQNLAIDPLETPVSTTAACWGPRMQEHAANAGESGLLPNGWYFTNPLGYNLFGTGLESGLDTYRLVLADAGRADAVTNAGVAGAFAGVMSMVRHLNAVDGDWTFDRMNSEIRGFEGPAMLQAGPLDCGAPPVFTGVCSTRVSAHRYIDESWDDVRAGDNLIDISPIIMQEG